MAEFGEVDAFPLRAFRFEEVEGQPSLNILFLSSGPDGSGKSFALLVTRDHLRSMAREFERRARSMPPPVKK